MGDQPFYRNAASSDSDDSSQKASATDDEGSSIGPDASDSSDESSSSDSSESSDGLRSCDDEFWADVWDLLAEGDAAADLAPAELASSEEVLPQLSEDPVASSEPLAQKLVPALVAADDAPRDGESYPVREAALPVRLSLGDAEASLGGGAVGGRSEQDPFVFTVELPYLMPDAAEGPAMTLSAEEWALRTALAQERKSGAWREGRVEDAVAAVASRAIDKKASAAPRAVLVAEEMPAEWSLWQQHGDGYRRLGAEDLARGVSGRIVARYEGAEGALALTAGAEEPPFSLELRGDVPENAVVSVIYGYEYHSWTPSDEEGDRALTGRVLRRAAGAVDLVNAKAPADDDEAGDSSESEGPADSPEGDDGSDTGAESAGEDSDAETDVDTSDEPSSSEGEGASADDTENSVDDGALRSPLDPASAEARTFLMGALPLATPRSNVSPETVINPHPLLLTENEPIPGSTSTYLMKTGDLTRINLNMSFGFQSGWVGNAVNKTSFTVQVPYLYKDAASGGVLEAYTYSDILKAVAANPSENTEGYDAMRLAIVPDSSIFTEWDIVDDRGYRITKDTYSTYYPQGFTGTFTLSYRGANGLGQMGVNFKRPEFQVKFIGSIPENTGATVRVGGDTTVYNDMSSQFECRKHVEPGSMDDGATQPRTITFIKTNLEWTVSVTNKWRPAMWDKYNYMVYRVETKNISVDAETTLDAIGHTFRVTGERYGDGGMRVEDLMAWTDDGEPVPAGKQTPNAVDDDGNPLQLWGRPNEGGILIYDVTAVDDTIWDELDLDKFSNIDRYLEEDENGEAAVRQLSYQTGGQDAQFTYIIDRDGGGNLCPKTEETPDANDTRVVLIALPYTTNFPSFTMNGATIYPNVTFDTKASAYFGGRLDIAEDYMWSKELSNSDSFREAKNGLSYNKFAHDRVSDTWRAENSDAYDRLGYISKYVIRDITTLGNTPVFGETLENGWGAVITDTMPSNYEMVGLDFRMKRVADTYTNAQGEEVDIPNELSDFIFLEGLNQEGEYQRPYGVQFEMRSRASSTAPTNWVSLPVRPELVGPDPDDEDYDIYRLGGNTSAEGIASMLEARGFAAKPRNSKITGLGAFEWTGRFRILMAEELSRETVLPLDITIEGIMRAPASNGYGGRFTNVANGSFGRKQWVVQRGDNGGYYVIAKKGESEESSAHLLPEGVNPVIRASSFLELVDDSIAWGTPVGDPEMESIDVPLGADNTGYVFHLANDATSRIEPGTFETSTLRYVDNKYNARLGYNEFRGVETKQLILSKDFWECADVLEMIIDYRDPNYGGDPRKPETYFPETVKVKLSRADLEKKFLVTDEDSDLFGAIVIPQGALRSKCGNPYITHVKITYDTYESDTQLSDRGTGAFIAFDAHTSYTGEYPLTGIFSTNYDQAAQRFAEGTAQVVVKAAEPVVYASGFRGEYGETPVLGGFNARCKSDLGRPNSGLVFHLGNRSTTVLSPGKFSTSPIPFERASGERRGFETSRIVLTPELFECMTDANGSTVNNLVLHALDENDQEKTYVFSIETNDAGDVTSDTLTPLLDATGAMVLTPDLWDNNYFTSLEFTFGYMKNNETPVANAGARVVIYGTTTWLAHEISSVGTLESQYDDPTTEVHSTGTYLDGTPVAGAPCKAILEPWNGQPNVDAFAYDKRTGGVFSRETAVRRLLLFSRSAPAMFFA